MKNYLQKELEFNELIMDWNKKVNLVSRKKKDVLDLIDDSRIFLDYIDFSSLPKILDLGTGGGFPGIVIKIHHPEIHITLIDSIMKKITAVCQFTSKLGLKNIPAVCARAEDLGENNVFKHAFDYVVARSVGELRDLVKWSAELLKTGGKLLTLKGGDLEAEIKSVLKDKNIKDIDIIERGNRKLVIVSF